MLFRLYCTKHYLLKHFSKIDDWLPRLLALLWKQPHRCRDSEPSSLYGSVAFKCILVAGRGMWGRDHGPWTSGSGAGSSGTLCGGLCARQTKAHAVSTTEHLSRCPERNQQHQTLTPLTTDSSSASTSNTAWAARSRARIFARGECPWCAFIQFEHISNPTAYPLRYGKLFH